MTTAITLGGFSGKAPGNHICCLGGKRQTDLYSARTLCAYIGMHNIDDPTKDFLTVEDKA